MPIWPAFKQSPLEALCGEAEGSPALRCGKRQPQPRTTRQVNSGKLVYAAEWMRKTKYFSGKRKQKKGQGRSHHLWKAEGGSHVMKKMGTGLRSGTARFLMGSLPSAPWEVRSSALQTHEGHHLLQLQGQPLFPGWIILLQCTHNLPAGEWGKHRHKHITKSTQRNKTIQCLKSGSGEFQEGILSHRAAIPDPQS